MSIGGAVHQLSISGGGVPKLPVPRAVVGPLGLAGDRHRDTQNHGGPQRALCLYSWERIRALHAEGHPIVPGAIGENVTIAGLDWDLVVPGARIRMGPEVEVEVTSYTSPCSNIADAFLDGDFSRVLQRHYPGWSRVYARVLHPGAIRVGDAVQASR